MSNVTYADAKHNLQAVLREQVFHQVHQQSSWQRIWSVVWDWLQRHLHLSLSLQSLSPLAAIIMVLVVAGIIAGVVVWLTVRWRNRSWRLIEGYVNKSGETSVWQRLQDALAQEDWTTSLHLLVAAGVAYAQSEGWLQDRPYKTARLCVKEVQAQGVPEFADLFTELVRTAEQALFARNPVNPETVRYLTAQLEAWTKKVSA